MEVNNNTHTATYPQTIATHSSNGIMRGGFAESSGIRRNSSLPVGQYNIEKNKNGNIRLFWERLDAPHSFSTSEVPPKGPSVTDATFSPGPGNQNGHLASKRSRKRAIFS
jgi:hypothetical protein